ncbi:MAG: META domain-containing protein [Lactobacillales bacterium]|nr:META domain-containing protein [Lactobacillales bacterium]
MKKLIFTSLCALGLAACSTGCPTDLSGRTYVLENSNITLAFSKTGNRFYGRGINHYYGSYQRLNDNRISMSAVGATLMAGHKNQLRGESEYFTWLPQAEFYSLCEKDRLVLTLKDGRNLYFNELQTVYVPVMAPKTAEEKKDDDCSCNLF